MVGCLIELLVTSIFYLAFINDLRKRWNGSVGSCVIFIVLLLVIILAFEGVVLRDPVLLLRIRGMPSLFVVHILIRRVGWLRIVNPRILIIVDVELVRMELAAFRRSLVV